MKFGYTIAYVRDVGKTVEFWERAFGLKRRFVGENNEYGEMETGETTLAFASNELGESNLPGGFRKNDPSGSPAGMEITLIAEDVEGAFRSALEAGATEVAEPKTKPWGQTVAYVRDPDGVLVEIGSEM
jgi:lactoylglutathione lyase